MNSKLVVLAGPTGSGKTALAMRLCEFFPFFEIVSADSVQVYRYLDVGSGKVSPQDRLRYPHFCIDIVDPDVDFDVSSYLLAAETAIIEVYSRGHVPLIVGGSGLYIDSLVFGLSKIPEVPIDCVNKLKHIVQSDIYGKDCLRKRLEDLDPEAAKGIHPNDMQRTIRALAVYETTGHPISYYWNKKVVQQRAPFFIVTDYARSTLYYCINERVDLMIRDGLYEEVERLNTMGYSERLKKTIGYCEIYSSLMKEISLPLAIEKMKQATRKYAKRQIAWFSRYDSFHYMGKFDDLVDKVKKYTEASMPQGGES